MMNYSPKLKTVMEQIKKIIKDNDIAASVVLHTPNFGEHYYNISPSYSYAKILPKGIGIEIRSNPDDTKEEKFQKLTDTANMFQILAELMSRQAQQIIEVSVELDAKLGANHTKGTDTSHESQNN